jgi:hypothetical protein
VRARARWVDGAVAEAEAAGRGGEEALCMCACVRDWRKRERVEASRKGRGGC